MLRQRFKAGWRIARPYFARHKSYYVAGAILLVASNAVQVSIPWLLKIGVDALSGDSDQAIRTTILWCAAGIIAAAIIQAIVRVGSRWVLFKVGRDVEFEFRQRAYEHILRLDPSWIQQRSRGDLISRVSNDIGNVRLLFGFGVLNVVNTVVAFVAALTVMFALSWSLTLLALAPYPLLMLVLSKFGTTLHKRFMGAQESLGGLSGYLQEALHGYEVVKGFAQEDGFYDRFRGLNQANYRANMRLAWTRSLMAPLMIFISGFGIFVVLAGGGWLVIQGELTLGDFVAFQGYMGMLVWPTLALGWLFNVLERGLASLQRVDEILVAEPEICDAPDAVDHQLAGDITIAPVDLIVSRDNDAQRFALRDLALEFKSGEKIAVVGRTGAGKSLLFRALLRLVDVPPGMIQFDGVDIRSIKLAALRRQVGYLSQEPFLFGRTIREVLQTGIGPMADDALAGALQRAAILDEVQAMPRGLDSRLGERGVSLSGGQRQRLMIARLLLTNPKILLFDSPLSALDFDTADTVRRTLEAFAGGRTLLWATHRLERMEWFDRIIVLSGGQIQGTGRHQDMLELEVYRSLYERQQLKRAVGSK